MAEGVCTEPLTEGFAVRVDGTPVVSNGPKRAPGCDRRRAEQIISGSPSDTSTTATWNCETCRRTGTVTGRGKGKRKKR